MAVSRLSRVRGGTRRVVAVAVLVSSLGAQTWSAPVDVSQVSAGASARAVLVAEDGRQHLVFRRDTGGAPQLFHARRARGQAWSTPTLVSTSGDSSTGAELPLNDGYRFCFLDRRGRVQLVFEKSAGAAKRVWHTEFDPDLPGAGWSTPIPVSSATAPGAAVAVHEDSRGGLHLCWLAVQGTGSTQLWHAFRPTAGSWSTPKLLSSPGAPTAMAVLPVRRGNRFLLEDRAGRVHVFFQQVGSGVTELWHRRFDVPATVPGWSPPVSVSGAGRSATAGAVELDRAGDLHVFWRALPAIGAPQLWHARLPVGQLGWSTPAVLSTPGLPSFGARLPPGDFVRTDGQGRVHVVFGQVPGTGPQRVFMASLVPGSGAFSTPVGVTPPGEFHGAIGMEIDQADGVHVLSSSLNAVFVAQIHHTSRPRGGSFGSTTLVSTPGSPSNDAGLSAVAEVQPLLVAPTGEIHVLFEQVSSSVGESRIWHRSLDPGAGSPAWSVPVDVSGNRASAASLYAARVDERAEIHAVFGAAPTTGSSEQLFHARRTRAGGWNPAVRVSTPGATRAVLPVVPWVAAVGMTPVTGTGYRWLVDDRCGSVALVFEKDDNSGATRVWQASLNRFSLFAATRVAGPGDLLVEIDHVPAGAAEGFVFLSADTFAPVGAGWFVGFDPDPLTGVSFSIPPTPGNLLHWTWPVAAPAFPAGAFSFPVGFLPVPAGLAIDFIGVTLDSSLQFEATNVVRLVF